MSLYVTGLARHIVSASVERSACARTTTPSFILFVVLILRPSLSLLYPDVLYFEEARCVRSSIELMTFYSNSFGASVKLPRSPHTLYSIPLSLYMASIYIVSLYPSVWYLSIYSTCLTIVQYRYNMENSAVGLLIACFVRLSPHAHQHPLAMKLKSPVPACKAFPFP